MINRNAHKIILMTHWKSIQFCTKRCSATS